MKQFNYVIAPEGCNEYLTAGKKYNVVLIGDSGYVFHFHDDDGNLCASTHLGFAHTNDNCWVIPEINQFPEGWTKKQKKECLRKAGVIEEPTNDFQGRTQQQVEGSYQIASLCFVAVIIIFILAVLFV